MQLTRHRTESGSRWALDGQFLVAGADLRLLLSLPAAQLAAALQTLATQETATGLLLAPVDADQEIWAAGVTYLRSREAREAESESSADAYEKVYNAARPEIFLKATGRRAVGPDAPIRVRGDSSWDVPEPEMTLVINSKMDVVGYTVGNDVSSRSIEGENPLYLPQAKIYNGSCALGPAIRLVEPAALRDLPIALEIRRADGVVFSGETRTSQMKRTPEELAAFLGRELDFPGGALLMTGTGIVPGDDFTLQAGDVVRIEIDGLVLENRVA